MTYVNGNSPKRQLWNAALSGVVGKLRFNHDLSESLTMMRGGYNAFRRNFGFDPCKVSIRHKMSHAGCGSPLCPMCTTRMRYHYLANGVLECIKLSSILPGVLSVMHLMRDYEDPQQLVDDISSRDVRRHFWSRRKDVVANGTLICVRYHGHVEKPWTLHWSAAFYGEKPVSKYDNQGLLADSRWNMDYVALSSTEYFRTDEGAPPAFDKATRLADAMDDDRREVYLAIPFLLDRFPSLYEEHPSVLDRTKANIFSAFHHNRSRRIRLRNWRNVYKC